MSTRQTNREISHLRAFLGNVTKYVKICCVIKPLQLLVARNSCRQKMAYMRSLPAHTVGHDLAHMLDSKGLKLIPGFAKHDLDHLILGYSILGHSIRGHSIRGHSFTSYWITGYWIPRH